MTTATITVLIAALVIIELAVIAAYESIIRAKEAVIADLRDERLTDNEFAAAVAVLHAEDLAASKRHLSIVDGA